MRIGRNFLGLFILGLVIFSPNIPAAEPYAEYCPCWEPENMPGLYAVPWRMDAHVNIDYEIIGPKKISLKLFSIDAWEDYQNGNCLQATVLKYPRHKENSCTVAWGLWDGDACVIQDDDRYSASYKQSLIRRSCEIAANETIGYILSVAN